jgi:ubiquinone/menaquinone biosynthesis C-methylase UbiE
MTTEKRDFNQAAATWDENPGRVKLARDIANSMINNLTITSDMNVMDFGCGTGLLTVRLQPFVRSITGVDSSQGMLDILNDKITKLQLPNVKTMLVDIEKGQNLNGNYQLIVSSLTLHHIVDLKPLLSQFNKIITPGGFLSIADLDSDDGQFHDNKTGVFHSGFDRAVIRKYFSEAGFDNIKDTTAATVAKPSFNQGIREFTIFLITGRKIAK